MARPCARGLDGAVAFAIGVSLPKATNMSVLAERGRKRDLSFVVLGKCVALFETRGWFVPKFVEGGASKGRNTTEPRRCNPPFWARGVLGNARSLLSLYVACFKRAVFVRTGDLRNSALEQVWVEKVDSASKTLVVQTTDGWSDHSRP